MTMQIDKEAYLRWKEAPMSLDNPKESSAASSVKRCRSIGDRESKTPVARSQSMVESNNVRRSEKQVTSMNNRVEGNILTLSKKKESLPSTA